MGVHATTQRRMGTSKAFRVGVVVAHLITLAGLFGSSMEAHCCPDLGEDTTDLAGHVPFYRCPNCQKVFLSRTSEWRHTKLGICGGLASTSSSRLDGRLRSNEVMDDVLLAS